MWVLAGTLALILLGPGLGTSAPAWISLTLAPAAIVSGLAASYLSWLRARPRLDRSTALATLSHASHAPGRAADADLASALLRASRCSETDCSRLTRRRLDTLEARAGRPLPRILIHNTEPVLASLTAALSDGTIAAAGPEPSTAVPAEPHPGALAHLLGALIAAPILLAIVAVGVASYAGLSSLGPFLGARLAAFPIAAVVFAAAYIVVAAGGQRGHTLAASRTAAHLVRRNRAGAQTATWPITPADTLIVITAFDDGAGFDDEAGDDAGPPRARRPQTLRWWFVPPGGAPAFSVTHLAPAATPWRDAIRGALPGPR